MWFLFFFKSQTDKWHCSLDSHPLCSFLQVTVNWFQMQQAQLVSLPAHYLGLSESAKLYEPGECYAEFARNLPKNLPKERLLSDPDNPRYGEHVETELHSSLQTACYSHMSGLCTSFARVS